MTGYPGQATSGLTSMSSFPDNKYLGQLMASAGSASGSSEVKYHSSGGQAEAGAERGKEEKYLGHIEAKYSLHHQQSEAGSDKQQQQYLGMMCRAVH